MSPTKRRSIPSRCYDLEHSIDCGKTWNNVMRMECSRKDAEEEMQYYKDANGEGSKFRLVVVKL